jgi:hypothetical protein
MKARGRPVLPEGTTVMVEILDAEEVSGSFGPQLFIKVAVRGGKFAGFEFADWSKLSKDPDSGETFVQLGTKSADIFEAAFGERYSPDMDHDPDALVGKRIMARVGLAGKKKDRNRLEFGTIGSAPNQTQQEKVGSFASGVPGATIPIGKKSRSK